MAQRAKFPMPSKQFHRKDENRPLKLMVVCDSGPIGWATKADLGDPDTRFIQESANLPISVLRGKLRYAVCGSREAGITISYVAGMDTSGMISGWK